MKTALLYIGTFLLGIAVIFGVMYGSRLFSNATTPLILHTPKPGITCASMITADGAAISCWKD